MNVIDMTGKVIGFQTVLSRHGIDNHGQCLWLVRCECGNVRAVTGGRLRRGEAMSCGCRKPEKCAAANTKHGDAARGELSAEYRAWSNMIDRCEREGNKQWKDYGGRGILVCVRWRESFAAFLEDMGRKPSPRHSIDRIDNDGNYEPGNCRWATETEQRRNKRNVKYAHLIEAAEKNGIRYHTLYARMRNRWAEERAVNEPLNSSKTNKRSE